MSPETPCESYRSNARYPRWGYLDRYAVNEHMARALLVSIALNLVLLFSYMTYRTYRPARPAPPRDTTENREPFHIRPIQIDVMPQPRRVRVLPPVRPPQRYGTLVVVDDAIVDADDELDLGLGRSGPAADLSASAPCDGCSDEPFFAFSDSADLPGPKDFVAYESAPELVDIEPPEYPDLAREAGIEGLVMVRALVNTLGDVVDVLVVQSVPMLDEAALDSARSAVFKPALQANNPVAVWIAIPIDFSLHD